MESNIAIVVPSNRPEQLAQFKEAWAPKIEEAEAKLYVVEDNQSTWDDIKRTLGKNAWIIPVRTDCIRSYGYLQAYQDGARYIVTLDDDVRPQKGNPIIEHVENLNRFIEPANWTRTLQVGPPTRGLPLMRRVVLSHGLWEGVPDVSAQVQIDGFQPFNISSPGNLQIIERGKFFPMSGMNLAWISPLTRILYFGLQGYDIRNPEKPWGLHRCGDILAGVMSKIMLDLNESQAVYSGTPFVLHERASDPIKNLELEKPGIHAPFYFAGSLEGSTSYLTMAERLFHMNYPSKVYCRNLGQAMRTWWELTKS